MKRGLPFALIVLSLIVFRTTILADRLMDERFFVDAFELVAHGRSPYESPGYLYPPPLAEWGGRATRAFGLRPTLIVLRAANAIGAALIAWASATIAVRRFAPRVVAAIAFLFVPQFVASGVQLGNPSALTAGLIGLGMVCVMRRPRLAAIPLGVSLAIKPMAIGAVIVLALQRRTRAVVLSLPVAAAIVALTPRYFRGFMHQQQALDRLAGGNISVHRVLALFGAAPPAWIVSAAVLLGFVAWARRVRGATAQLCVALAATVFTLPRVWGHTLAAFVPVLAVAFSRLPALGPPGEERSRRLLTAVLTLAAAIGLLVYDGFSFVPIVPPPVQGMLAAVPIACAFALLHFAARRPRAVAS